MDKKENNNIAQGLHKWTFYMLKKITTILRSKDLLIWPYNIRMLKKNNYNFKLKRFTYMNL